METEARKHALGEHTGLADAMDRLSGMEKESEASSHSCGHIGCKYGCQFSQVKIVGNDIPNSEISQPGWQLARDMLVEYDKAQGHR